MNEIRLKAPKKMDKELSRRLGILRFPLIVGIVFIHNFGNSVTMANGTVDAAQSNALVNFIENLISNGVARTAVPLFFLMSGYLFFYGTDWNTEAYFKKLRSRAKSLLVPFLLWNMLMLVMIAVAQSLPSTSGFFSGRVITPIAEYDWIDYPASLLGIGHPPISYQFWFIRDLMLLVLATPLIHQINQRFPAPALALLACLWLLGIGLNFIPSTEAILFFFLGSYVGAKQGNLMALDRFGPKAVLLYSILLVINAIYSDTSYHYYLHRIAIAVGVLSMLYLTKLAVQHERLTDRLLLLGTASFFVYAAHEPVLTVLRKLAYKGLHPEGASITLVLYLGIPLLLISVLLGVYLILQRMLPKFTSVIVGGR